MAEGVADPLAGMDSNSWTVRAGFSFVDVYKIRWPSYRVAEKAFRLPKDHVMAS